ncbi:MAG: porin [Rhodospirillaceae bacterium]
MSRFRTAGNRFLAPAAFAVGVMLAVTPVRATDFFMGGAWDALDENGRVPTEIFSQTDTEGQELPVSFTAGVDVVTDTDLTIGYTLPTLGIFGLDLEASSETWTDSSMSLAQRVADDAYGSYATSFKGGQFGVFGGVKDEQSAFAMELTTSRTVGASVGYAGFYVRGAYQDSGPDGLLDGRRAWQAGLGYGSSDFDVRLTYVESAFVQGSPTELEGKQWMIGGLVQVTPSILLNANAYIVDRELAMPTVEPPGTGARVGVQLRF